MKYAKYKPTGIPWLPQIPGGWEVRRAASFLKVKDAPSAPDEELLSVFLDRGVIRFSDGGEKRANATSKDLSKYQLVVPGDFVLNNQQAWRGSVGVSPYCGIVSPAYFVVQLGDCIDPKYANIAFRSKPFVSVFELCSRGVGSIQRNLIWNMFKQRHLPLPPLPIQREIVAFLDEKCGKVDQLVAAKEKEVALLKELRERVIADAVTGRRGTGNGERGMGESCAETQSRRGKTKPSGIAWLPEVPEGWEVRRAASFLKVKDAPSAPEEELLSVFLDRGVIRFSEGGEKRANATSKDLSKYQLVEPDDFVMNNQQAWRGSVGVSPYRGIVSPAYFVVQLGDCIDPKYANIAFRSKPFVSVFELCSRGVGSIQRNLIWNMFKQQHLPLPPLHEQREIVAYIEAKTAKIGAAVAGLEREIAALKEFKQRLIADVVTGQRRVA